MPIKNIEDLRNDLQKAQWYENKAKSLRDETM